MCRLMIKQSGLWYGATMTIGWSPVMMVVQLSNSHMFLWFCCYYVCIYCSSNVVLYCFRYWQSNMNNVKANKSAHKESVRGLR
jgi:hypothetical protein